MNDEEVKVMNKEDHLIWTSDPDYEDWQEELEADMPDASEKERKEFMYAANSDTLQFEREELSHQYPQEILVIADLGLWNGRRMAYKEIESGKLSDCFEPSRDTLNIRWYVDRNGDLRCDDSHHDGTNHYLYRVWKDGISENQKENLREKIYNGVATRYDITRATERLGDEIGRVYGWTFPTRHPARER